ncbi:replication protein A 32 kDa subunit A [Nymphaea colorata]|uniref:replication protein A 32 kDa subunit A n=1 Tax=Nymphaea colorata TaxID=210225 RepID=UPI00129D92CB|nr:replication protein A 32 kDa subunit A [Nymphaea colorata]
MSHAATPKQLLHEGGSAQSLHQVQAYQRVAIIRPITDFDELTFHYVDCIAVHVDHVKRQSGGAQMQPSSTLSVFQNGSVGHQPLSLIK